MRKSIADLLDCQSFIQRVHLAVGVSFAGCCAGWLSMIVLNRSRKEMLTDVQQRNAAKKFAEEWKGKGYEKGETHRFWMELLQKVCGVVNPSQFIKFEVQVALKHTSFIDAYISETRVMIEQKSKEVELVKTLLLEKASADFDWSDISPTIFGAVFESTLNPETRRSGGMHYTSIENIHKVIGPLFLDSLKEELDDILRGRTVPTRNKRLVEFQEKLAGLTFLDPACGSGNFLTETYLSLRRLENTCLSNAPSVFIESRSKPLCDVPEIGIGNKPIDDGNYLFLPQEKDEFLKKEPQAAPYFRPWYGSQEFINNKPRWCLWLGECSPAELRKMPECMKRVENVRNFRLASKSEGTRKIADKPTRFHVENMPKDNYIVLPETSSERRFYTPIGFLTSEVLCSNALRLMPSATLYHFGILTSSVHMAWMRVVAGRLKSDYRYSKDIVYNNFPWCEPTEAQKATIEKTAQEILDARALYPDCSLADLYDEMTMPPELRKAHQANDRAVLKAYGYGASMSETEIVADLMKRYQQLTAQE